ncbi:Fip1-domain-containing protein [Heliocybe sulcata]|uniref:Fip1-domain-containing protein n=1 Tax=Heliocybe sulcata TaxID=5364 RepID=A0A5C3NJ05_9AGAM|nr:Fip1-domain-containing protein [Heliocybe sulcata]
MDEDDDAYLYGEPTETERSGTVATSVPQPIPLEKAQPANGVLAQMEASVKDEDGGDHDEEEGDEGEGDEGEESDDDVEIIMEPANRSLDFRCVAFRSTYPRWSNSAVRQNRPSATRTPSITTSTPVKGPPAPSLTTEYMPRERGDPLSKTSQLTPQATPQPPSSIRATSQISDAQSQSHLQSQSQDQKPAVEGPDPNTLPPAHAPPSHPGINPSQPGTVDGRSIFEYDIQAMADKPWRRPGSDISDWFNYGFDEISWEAYCFRRREMGDVASVMKANVLNFAGMPEDQIASLPPEIRTMIMANVASMGANPAMMGMNPMMHPDMAGMMGPMGMGDMGNMGNMGMGMQGGQMMPEGMDPGAGNGGTPEGMGQGFVPGAGGPMGMGMGGDFGMQGMQEQNVMGQQMYTGMEGNGTPGPGQSATPTQPGPGPGVPRGPATPVSYRGRPMQQGVRGIRGGYGVGRGRGHVSQALPVRPASPLPPNVPTGPRNQKYRDKDANAPAVDGLDYGGGGGGAHRDNATPDDDRSSRKRRGSPNGEDRSSKRR